MSSVGPNASSRAGRHEDEDHEPSDIVSVRTYPSSHSGRHEDQDHHPSDIGSARTYSRRGPEPAQPPSSPPTPADGRSQIRGETERQQEQPIHHVAFRNRGANIHPLPAGSPDNRPSPAHRPSLATVDEGKKLGHTRIRGGTNYRDEDLDPRKRQLHFVTSELTAVQAIS